LIRAILIGSDCPDLPREIIDKGFAALTSRDAVIRTFFLTADTTLIGF